MKYRLDRSSPIPLYHQIAETVRWKISTGHLRAGERLPPVREAAEAFGANRHTVRQAYRELARDGLVESLGPRGTWVMGWNDTRGRGAGAAEERSFLERAVREAKERFGMGPEELLRRLAAHFSAEPRAVIHVLECSESQCLDHAEELRARWDVEVRPWSLESTGEPPPGTLVATYFHYAEILRRWPHRKADVHFVAIQPDPELVPQVAGMLGSDARLIACDFDETKARNLTADLAVLFPPERFRIDVLVVEKAGDALARPADTAPVCFAPRVFAALTDREKNHPRAVKARFVIEPQALDDLGSRLGWRSAARSAPDPRTAR